MEIRNLYLEYFEEKSKYLPYEEEHEYWKDLFSYLDIFLSIAVLTKMHMQRGEQELRLDQIHLRGVALHAEEMIRELSKNKLTGTELFPVEMVETAVGNARMHIINRLLHTPQDRVLRYRYLMEVMKFTEWEQFLFLLSFAACYDTKYETIFAYLQGDVRYKLPMLRLAVSLFQMAFSLSDEEIAFAVQKKGQLFQIFLEISTPSEYNPMAYMMSLNERVCAFLYGKNEVEATIAEFSELYCFTEPVEPVLIRQALKEQIADFMGQMISDKGEKGNVMQLYGPEGIGKKFLLKSIAAEEKINLLFVDVSKILLGSISELLLLFPKIRLESMLLGAIVCFTGYEHPVAENEIEMQKLIPQGLRFLMEEIQREYLFVVWLSREKADFLMEYAFHLLYQEVPMLTVAERECLWKEYVTHYPVSSEVDIRHVASQYILTPHSMKEVLWDAGIHEASADGKITREGIREAVGRQVRNQLGKCATRISSVYTWEDLVIGSEQKRQLELLCNQMRYRSIVGDEWGFYKRTTYGHGVCAMFYGASGTGKTMAVQVVANELGLELYRIDLSQIISKYIGETQKNISELFRRARNTNALLFFDEADSLFAKRSEVKDSHDRNANAETAHLLQKLEDYDGITILATNYINNIDEAFKRRIKIMVNFPFPTAEIRKELWQTILPEGVPLQEEIDFDFFAEKFALTGSSIKEILTNAAFCAAAAGRGLCNADVVEAVQLNFAKYGKVLTKEDFGYIG